MTDFGEADVVYTKDGYVEDVDHPRKTIAGRPAAPPHDDPRWPSKCEACGEPFFTEDPFQLFGRQIYVRPDTGQRFTLEEVAPGAVWDCGWISDRKKDCPTGSGYMVGPDHRSLCVRTPDGHDWMIDGRASNCTIPKDNEHFCWVRHGKPEDGTLHVDKNGRTCAAGAGSIATGKWHGLLHNGYLHT
ncbi:MAG: hypothetical protein ACREML_04510 [Vulcanimicrobiaceae bacterium]